MSSVVKSSLNPKRKLLRFCPQTIFFLLLHHNLISAVISTNVRSFLRLPGVVLQNSVFFLPVIVHLLTPCFPVPF